MSQRIMNVILPPEAFRLRDKIVNLKRKHLSRNFIESKLIEFVFRECFDSLQKGGIEKCERIATRNEHS